MTKEDKTFQALTQREMVKENVELTERVKELKSDYNIVVKQMRANPVLSQLTEALYKVTKLERDRDLFYKEYEKGQRLYESLFNQYDAQTKELETAREACKAAKEQYNDLQREYTVSLLKNYAAKSELQKLADERDAIERRYEELKDAHNMRQEHLARIGHSSLVRKGSQCRRDAKVNVDSEVCLNCKHCMLSFLSTTDYILCAHDYDKQKEKQ